MAAPSRRRTGRKEGGGRRPGGTGVAGGEGQAEAEGPDLAESEVAAPAWRAATGSRRAWRQARVMPSPASDLCAHGYGDASPSVLVRPRPAAHLRDCASNALLSTP